MNTIKIGSKGEDVKTLQKLLGLTVDGDFGVNTDKKVKEWQTANNLVADGIVGAKTWEKLLSQTNTSSDCGISMGMIEFICFQETGKHFGKDYFDDLLVTHISGKHSEIHSCFHSMV